VSPPAVAVAAQGTGPAMLPMGVGAGRSKIPGPVPCVGIPLCVPRGLPGTGCVMLPTGVRVAGRLKVPGPVPGGRFRLRVPSRRTLLLGGRLRTMGGVGAWWIGVRFAEAVGGGPVRLC
jgi:hypothetical protein